MLIENIVIRHNENLLGAWRGAYLEQETTPAGQPLSEEFRYREALVKVTYASVAIVETFASFMMLGGSGKVEKGKRAMVAVGLCLLLDAADNFRKVASGRI